MDRGAVVARALLPARFDSEGIHQFIITPMCPNWQRKQSQKLYGEGSNPSIGTT